LVGTNEGSADYERLIEQIKTYDDWGRVQKSVWLVKSGATSEQIFKHLWSYMDSNDRLFVVRLVNEAAWSNELCDRDWLNNFFDTP
jgi:hypothetical protein